MVFLLLISDNTGIESQVIDASVMIGLLWHMSYFCLKLLRLY